MKNTLLIICCLILPSLLLAQNTFEAIILDSETEENIVGATVYVQYRNNMGSTTDTSGRVLISNIPDGKQTIVIRYLGYETIKIKTEF